MVWVWCGGWCVVGGGVWLWVVVGCTEGTLAKELEQLEVLHAA